ncbi:MAG: superinfection immunity protein [Legionella sp.]|nr:superinfection immunity protein [Legionella sp.]
MIYSYGLTDLDFLILGATIALTVLYFLPTIVAIKKSHPSTVAISVLNLLIGFFFFGWVASLVWALSNSNKTIIIYKSDK